MLAGGAARGFERPQDDGRRTAGPAAVATVAVSTLSGLWMNCPA